MAKFIKIHCMHWKGWKNLTFQGCFLFLSGLKEEAPLKCLVFPAVFNAYFDKLCHSFIHSFIFALFFKFLKAPFNFLPIEELYVCKSRMQARPHAYLWNLVICPSEKFWWWRDHLSAGPSAPQETNVKYQTFWASVGEHNLCLTWWSTDSYQNKLDNSSGHETNVCVQMDAPRTHLCTFSEKFNIFHCYIYIVQQCTLLLSPLFFSNFWKHLSTFYQ